MDLPLSVFVVERILNMCLRKIIYLRALSGPERLLLLSTPHRGYLRKRSVVTAEIMLTYQRGVVQCQ